MPKLSFFDCVTQREVSLMQGEDTSNHPCKGFKKPSHYQYQQVIVWQALLRNKPYLKTPRFLNALISY